MMSHFSHFSRSNERPVVTDHNYAEFGLDPKSGSRFRKEYSWTGFQKMSF